MKNLKRIVSMLLVIAMLAAMPVVASAAGVTVTHKHTMVKTATQARGCYDAATETYECKDVNCSYTYTVTLKPSYHDYPDYVQRVENGDDWDYVCKGGCSFVLFSAPKSCTHTLKDKVVSPATCYSPEFIISECTETDKGCKYKTTKVGAGKLSHKWGEWTETTPATTTTLGEATRICEYCGEPETAPLPMLSQKHQLSSVTAALADVYDSPSAAGKVKGYLPNGTKVMILGQTEDGTMYQVEGSGWVNAADLDTLVPSDSSVTISCGSHSFKEIYVTTPVACTDKAYVTTTCTNPGCYYLSFSTKASDSHKWNKGEVTTPATAADAGEKTFTCLTCGETKTEVIPKLSYTNTIYKVTPSSGDDVIPVFSTATKNVQYLVGFLPADHLVTGYGTSSEGMIQIDKTHDYWVDESELTPEAGGLDGERVANCGKHSYKEIYRQPAGCGETGYVTKICSNDCDFYQFTKIDALAHQWGEGRVVKEQGEEPTVTSTGLKRYYCVRKNADGTYVHSPSHTKSLEAYLDEMDALTTADVWDAVNEKANLSHVKVEKLAKSSATYVEGEVVDTGTAFDAKDENGVNRKVVEVYKGTGVDAKLSGFAPVGTHFTCFEKMIDIDGSNNVTWVCIDNSVSGGYWVREQDVKLGTAPTTQTKCTHTSAKSVFKWAATCENAEFITRYCSECGRITLATGLAALGHNWDVWKTVTAPTDTYEGEEARECKRCHETESRKIEKLDEADIGAYGFISGGEYIEIYDGFNAGHELIGYGTKGTTIQVVNFNQDGTWVEISDDGTSNGWWVRSSDVTLGSISNNASIYSGAESFGFVPGNVDVTVYAGKKTTSAVLGSLAKGAVVPVYKIANADGEKWAKISATEQKWVLYKHVEKGLLPMLLTQALDGNGDVIPNEIAEKVIARGHVTTTIGLKVRKYASVESDEIGFLDYATYCDPADPVIVYEIKTVNGVEWGRIKEDTLAALGTNSGWVCLTYVSYEKEDDAPTTGGTPNVTTYSGVVSTGGINLNVRKSADVMSDKVGALANTTKVTIYETKKAKNGVEWGRISQDKIDGWVCMQYVTLQSSTSTTGGTVAAATVNATVANCATGVNVRNKSDISGTQVAKIPVGTRIAVTKLEKGWGYVDGKGWVYLEYVAFDAGAEDAIKNPVSTTPTEGNETPVATFTNISLPASIQNAAFFERAGGASVAKNAKLLTVTAKADVTVSDQTIINNKTWCKISYAGITGWVNKDSVTFKNVEGAISTAQTKIYDNANVDSSVTTILGVGSKLNIKGDTIKTDGVYVWGQITGIGGWVQLNNVTLDTVVQTVYVPTYSNYPTITGVTLEAVKIVKEPESGADKVGTIPANASVMMSDWTWDDVAGICYGKVTYGELSGWIAYTAANFEQNSVMGTVSADALTLYSAADINSEKKLTLRTGDKVTVTERFLVGNAAWGRMVAAKDTAKQELFANLAGITLNGQTITNVTDTVITTPVETTPVAPTTVTIGIVTGADEVNVRSDPHATSALLTKLKKGTQVKVSQQITSDGAAWAKIEQGWMAMQYINLQAGTVVNSDGSATVTGTTIMTTVPTGAIAAGFTSIDNLAVRSSAGVGMPQVKTLAKGSSVVIKAITQANGLYWGQIDEGWICMSYVTVTAVGSTNAGTAGTIGRCFYTVNVRSAAGVANAITAKIMVSANVRIYETAVVSGETWGRTDLGWVSMQYVVS